jgi:pimeloyl-ACP methyl ester carboxylesterase
MKNIEILFDRMYSVIPDSLQKPIGAFALEKVIKIKRKLLGAKEKFTHGIHYLEIDGGHPETMILIHGFSDSKDGFLEPATYLAKKYNLIIPDLPGFGSNEKDETITYSTYEIGKNILGFVEELKILNPHILGISLGAAIAMEVVLLKPEYPKSLSLISPAGFFDEDKTCIYHEILEGNNIFCIEGPEDYEGLLNRVMANRPYIPSPIRLHLGEMLVKEREWLDKMASDLLGGLSDLSEKDKIAELSYNHRVENIICPVLLIWGEKDSLFPPNLSEIPKSKIKNSKLVLIPDAGHALHHEKPELFSREVHHFIKSI